MFNFPQTRSDWWPCSRFALDRSFNSKPLEGVKEAVAAWIINITLHKTFVNDKKYWDFQTFICLAHMVVRRSSNSKDHQRRSVLASLCSPSLALQSFPARVAEDWSVTSRSIVWTVLRGGGSYFGCNLLGDWREDLKGKRVTKELNKHCS